MSFMMRMPIFALAFPPKYQIVTLYTWNLYLAKGESGFAKKLHTFG